jgi:hypothetical protein
MSHAFQPSPVILADVEGSMPFDLLRETAYAELLGIDRSLCPVYRDIEQVMREMEKRVDRAKGPQNILGLQQQLVSIERTHKRNGVWEGDLQVAAHSPQPSTALQLCAAHRCSLRATAVCALCCRLIRFPLARELSTISWNAPMCWQTKSFITCQSDTPQLHAATNAMHSLAALNNWRMQRPTNKDDVASEKKGDLCVGVLCDGYVRVCARVQLAAA